MFLILINFTFNAIIYKIYYTGAPQIIEAPHDVHSRLGETIEMPCLMTGDPTPEIIWMQNTNYIPTDDEYSNRLQILPSGSLRINSVESNDIGVYECIGRNSMGEIKTPPVRMQLDTATYHIDNTHYNNIISNKHLVYDLDQAPSFVYTPKDLTISLHGDAVLLDCMANGKPTPEIQWYFNGRLIAQSTDNMRLQANGSLVLYDPSLQMTGVYRCEATNHLGKIQASANIDVKGKWVYTNKQCKYLCAGKNTCCQEKINKQPVKKPKIYFFF